MFTHTLDRSQISIEEGLLEKIPSSKKVFVITDEKIWALHSLAHLHPHVIFIPSGEEGKTLAVAQKCWQELLNNGCDRSSHIIALGGGSVTDLAGFVASTFMRGIPLTFIPTTLLGMVDASIGGKNGVNLPEAKNYIGTIYHPHYILIDPKLLKTLPRRQLQSGLAEVVKYGLIAEPNLLENITPSLEIISKCVQTKISVIQRDIKESGYRDILNYGHTLGHAIESALGYGQILHGEAIAIGMHFAAKLSVAMGLLSSSKAKNQQKLLESLKFSLEIPDISPKVLIQYMEKDKKNRNGNISFVLLEELGKAIICDHVPRDLLFQQLKNPGILLGTNRDFLL